MASIIRGQGQLNHCFKRLMCFATVEIQYLHLAAGLCDKNVLNNRNARYNKIYLTNPNTRQMRLNCSF